jgi:hypothetical protein
MLKDLRQYNNFGTPNYFFQLLTNLKENDGTVWRKSDIEQFFHNKIIDGRSIYDGCIELAIRIEFLILQEDLITINKTLIDSLNNINQMSDKFLEFLFKALTNDEIFHNIFCSEFLTYDIIHRTLKISNSAFGFKFANFKQLLIDFDAIKAHPTIELNSYIINTKYKKLFDKTVLPEIKRRKIGIEEFKNSIELQQIYGEEAEKFVLDFEYRRLNKLKEIDWVAEYIVNEGYDIASYNNENDKSYNRFIEVKSYDGDTPYFFWSRNECNVARIKKDNYWLYLVSRKKIDKIGYKPIMVQNPYVKILNNDNWKKEIDKYKIVLKDKNLTI